MKRKPSTLWYKRNGRWYPAFDLTPISRKIPSVRQFVVDGINSDSGVWRMFNRTEFVEDWQLLPAGRKPKEAK